MTLLTTTQGLSLSVEEIADLVVRPLIAASTALQTTTVLNTDNSKLRIPVVAQDPPAAFTPENQEIGLSDVVPDTCVIDFYKIAALSRVSSETMEDADPEISTIIGDGIARDVARVTDKAFFQSATANGYAGIESLVGQPGAAGCQVVDVGDVLTNLDP